MMSLGPCLLSSKGACCMQDMDWCQEYAFHNRRVMMDLLASAVEHVTGKTPFLNRAVNIHHNYCQCEQCSWKVGPARILVKPWRECWGWGAALYLHPSTWLIVDLVLP